MVELIAHGWPAIWEEPRNNNRWRCGKRAFRKSQRPLSLGFGPSSTNGAGLQHKESWAAA